QISNRLPCAALLKQGRPEVVVRFGKVRVEAQREFVMSHRLLRLPALKQGRSKIVVHIRVIWTGSHGVFQMFHRSLNLALLKKSFSQSIKDRGDVRLNGQSFWKDGDRLVHLPLLERKESEVNVVAQIELKPPAQIEPYRKNQQQASSAAGGLTPY